eukprot:1195569-Prorocentrum_minimum.AAC.11
MLQFAIGVVAFLSAMVTTDRIYHFYTALYFRHWVKTRPEDQYPIQPLPRDMVRPDAQEQFIIPRCSSHWLIALSSSYTE